MVVAPHPADAGDDGMVIKVQKREFLLPKHNDDRVEQLIEFADVENIWQRPCANENNGEFKKITTF